MYRALLLALFATPTLAGGEVYEEVQLKTGKEIELSGRFFQPRKKSSSTPAALLIHDAGADQGQLEGVAVKLQKSGFAVLTLDLRGHGLSRASDEPEWSALDTEARKSLWAFSIADIEAGAEWLREQDGIHRTNLSVVGVGSGCALAVRHASRDENVRCVALIQPNERDFGFDVAQDIREIEGLPTYVVAARTRTDTEKMVTEANSSAGDDPYIELFQSSSKTPNALDDRKMPSRVASWIKGVAMPKKGRGRG